MASFRALRDRKSGTLVIESSAVRFEPDGDRTETDGASTPRIPFAELEVGLTGQNQTYVSLARRGRAHPAILASDLGVLGELASRGFVDAEALARRARSRHVGRRVALALLIAAVVLPILALPWAVKRVPSTWLDHLTSFETERRLGELLLSREIRGPRTSADEHAQSLARFLMQSSPELARLPIETRVSPSRDVNAFALPGAIVVLNRGLLYEARTIEEVLGVLAHELGHVERRHVLRSLATNLGFMGGVALLGLFVDAQVAAWVLRGGNLALMSHSRDFEREADEKAFEILRRARVSSRGLVEFFGRLGEKHGTKETALSWLSTHPVSGERAERLLMLERESPYEATAEIPIDLERIRRAAK